MHVVLHLARGNPLDAVPPTLLAPGFGLVKKGSDTSSLNYGGNIETSPPVTVGGKKFILGRFIYGSQSRGSDIMDMDAFYTAQQVQDPVRLDTTWLSVGHVDETITMVPTSSGFRLVMASAQRALDVLQDLQNKGNGGAPVMVGRQDVDMNFNPIGNLETTVTALLKNSKLVTFNELVAKKIKEQRNLLTAGLGIKDSDVIDLPVLYRKSGPIRGLADAFTGGMANMLIVNGHAALAKPFGPVVGGVDMFEQEAINKLSPLGLTLHFIDDWYTYHLMLGEVHCGTNTIRTENQFNWWEFEP